MNKLQINITKATLQSFSITAKDGMPEVHVTLGLMTEGGKTITTYTADTHAWSEKDKLELPMSAMPLIGELARILEKAAVSHCRDSQLALPEPVIVPKGTTVFVDAPTGSVTNLDDIPF